MNINGEHNLSFCTKNLSTPNYHKCICSLCSERTVSTSWSGTKTSSVGRTCYQIKSCILAKSLWCLPSLFQIKKKCTQHHVGFNSTIKLQNHTLFSASPNETKFLFRGRRVPLRRKTIVLGLIKSEKDLVNVPFEPHNPLLISRQALKQG